MLVIPVYNMILAPDATLYLQTEQIQGCSAGKGFSIEENVVLIVVKEDAGYQDLSEDSFFPIGVSGSITDLNERGFVTIRTGHRVNVESVWFNPDRTIALSTSEREELNDLDRGLEAEKLVAAERAGITKVFIPKGNMLDLKDVAQEVKDKLEIVPVSEVTELLAETGIQN